MQLFCTPNRWHVLVLIIFLQRMVPRRMAIHAAGMS
jgi:hypothetical protein